jgi:hypothetical protein
VDKTKQEKTNVDKTKHEKKRNIKKQYKNNEIESPKSKILAHPHT